jgi:hypothetical protein
MAVSKAQLRTLTLLNQEAACRAYSSNRASDYKWIHEQSDGPLTPTLHKLFVGGYAKARPDNKVRAVTTAKGRALLRGHNGF